MPRRTDTDNKRYFRTAERVVRQNGHWFFMSREGELGPFSSENEAYLEGERHVDACKSLEAFSAARRRRDERRNPILTEGILANVQVTSLAIVSK